MMMIYLTGDAHNGVFDFLDAPEYGHIHTKKMVGRFDLVKTLRQLSQNALGIYDFIAVDLDCLTSEVDEICETLRHYRSFMSERFIFYAEGQSRGDEVIQRLMALGLYNLITGDTVAAIREQIIACVSVEGMSYSTLSSFLGGGFESAEPPTCFLPNQAGNIRIVLAGTEAKVGVTSTAFNLLCFLIGIGAKCAYFGTMTEGELTSIEDFYRDAGVPFQRRDHYWEYGGGHFYSAGQEQQENYDFVLHDVGVINERVAPLLANATRTILVTRSKPWELPALSRAKELLFPDSVHLLLLSTNMNQQNQIRTLAGTGFLGIHFVAYAPDLLDGQTNAAVFRTILGDLIVENHSAAPTKKERRRFLGGERR